MKFKLASAESFEVENSSGYEIATPTVSSNDTFALVSDLSSKASTADATLVPVYSQTPPFSEWTLSEEGRIFEIVWQPEFGRWMLAGPSINECYCYKPYNAIRLEFNDGNEEFVATRTRLADIIGYQLGSQSDKPLAPADNYALLENICSAFASGSSYAVGDLVLYSNTLYRCVYSHTGAWDSSHFTTATVGDVLNGKANAVHTHPASSISYTDNQTVLGALDELYQTNLWMSDADNTLMRDKDPVSSIILRGDKTVATTDQIPTVNDSTITIQKNSVLVDSFTTNASAAKTINITVPTSLTDLTNDLTALKDQTGTYLLSAPSTTATGTLALTSDIPNPRYAIVTPEQTTSGTSVSLSLADRAINQVALGSTVTTATISFPAKTAGYARDFFVRLTITGTTVPAITWQESDGSAIDFDVDDDSWGDIEQGVNILMFTETNQATPS